MLTRSNQEIVDDIILRCSEKLDKQLYLLENILGERDTLSLLDDSLYFYVAGNVLMLKPDGSDISNNPVLITEENKEYYVTERNTILKYLLTIIHYEVADNHDEALNACIKMLETTTRTFSREFLNVLHLIVLFDKDELYKNICRPLANFCVQIIYTEYKSEEVQQVV
ncbi:hypothetical protein [Lysinibacillus xylanilyticus]|uniref:hypothetical protein n=1 Tax=Lysinibacillus xylanilyticus TaxID=582475 RepID=UPI0036D94028